MIYERNTENRYRPRMKWYVKALIIAAVTTLVIYIGGMIYVVRAKYSMNDYVVHLGAAFNAATIVNATETYTDEERAVIAEYEGRRAVIIPENYKPLQSYLRSVVIDMKLNNMGAQDWQALALVSDKTVKCAQIFLASLPILCVYPFLQKYFVKGMVLGSVKG